MARGTVAVVAHFSGMSRSSSQGMSSEDREVVRKVGQTYDMSRHARGDASHAQLLDAAFIERFAIAGAPSYCVRRFEPLLKLGLDHFVIIGPGADAAPSDMAQAMGFLQAEVLPALKSTSRNA
jgi:alkanesulfonate monooxygenase SsuD/methylene tetrahydromethanopterin reductase-like flavin-dependent oxidoreductase (luciferase family)